MYAGVGAGTRVTVVWQGRVKHVWHTCERDIYNVPRCNIYKVLHCKQWNNDTTHWAMKQRYNTLSNDTPYCKQSYTSVSYAMIQRGQRCTRNVTFLTRIHAWALEFLTRIHAGVNVKPLRVNVKPLHGYMHVFFNNDTSIHVNKHTTINAYKKAACRRQRSGTTTEAPQDES